VYLGISQHVRLRVHLSFPSTLLGLFTPLYPHLHYWISHSRTACKPRLSSNQLLLAVPDVQWMLGKKSLKKSWALPGGIWTTGPEAPENRGESPSSVLYAVTFSASYEEQSFELERHKTTILCKVRLHRLQFLTSLTLEDMRQGLQKEVRLHVLLLNSISCCHC